MGTLVQALHSGNKSGSQTQGQGLGQQHLQSQGQAVSQVNPVTCFCCGHKGHHREVCKLKDTTCKKAGHVKSNSRNLPGIPAYVYAESKKLVGGQTPVAKQSPQVPSVTPQTTNPQTGVNKTV